MGDHRHLSQASGRAETTRAVLDVLDSGGPNFVRLFFTPPVLTVLVAPLPGAAIVGAVGGSQDALMLLGIGWMIALLAIVPWLLLVVPIIVSYGRTRAGRLGWRRALLSSAMASFCLGAVFGVVSVYSTWSFDQYLFENSVLAWSLVFSYIGLLGACFLMYDPFFTDGV